MMSFDRKKYNALGTAEVKNIDQMEAWLATEDGKHFIHNRWSATLNAKYANNWNPAEHDCFYELQGMIPGYHEAAELYDKTGGKSRFERLKESVEFYKILGQPFDVLYIGKGYAVICDATYPYLIPLEFLNIVEYKNYDNIPVSALKALGASADTSLIQAGEGNLSVAGVKDKMQEKEEQLKEAEQQIELLKQEKEEKLEQLRRELEAAYKDKFSLIEKKMAEMQELKKSLEQQLLVLDTEIYGIRCYNGEAVKFSKLKDGVAADINEPIVVHQKFRYLDEEMGKLLSVYDLDGSTEDLKYFEKAVTAREDIRDIFLPQDKCICFVKVSRSGLIRLPSEVCANMLDTYEKYHGRKIGILIRNGEQIYMGWTSEDRIAIRDENAFYGNNKSIEQQEDYGASSSMEEKISRYFIYAVLQGVLDNGRIISLPQKVSVINPSPYIIYSLADAWIEDNRFGNFVDIVDRTQRPYKVGDMVLTVLSIARDDKYETSSRYRRWNNDRGRGEKNRTHDVCLQDCTLYPVNHIDRTDSYDIFYLEYPCYIPGGEQTVEDGVILEHEESSVQVSQGPPTINSDVIGVENYEKWGISTRGLTPEEIYEKFKEIVNWLEFDDIDVDSRIWNGEVVKKAVYRKYYKTELHDTEYKNYISAEKDANWETGKCARANLMFYNEEVINITFLNSVWVRYAINNRKVGHFRVGGNRIDYAQAVRYLNKLLPYLDDREKEEAAMISKFMDLYEDWQVDLSEWKLKNDIHRLTDTRAKKFAKYMEAKRGLYKEE